MAYKNTGDMPDLTTYMEFEWGADYEYMVDATIYWSYEGHDGIGEYEYWGSKGYDEGDPVFEISSMTFTVYNYDGDAVTLAPEIMKEIESTIYELAEPNFD
jgi:hypothetical protein